MILSHAICYCLLKIKNPLFLYSSIIIPDSDSPATVPAAKPTVQILPPAGPVTMMTTMAPERTIGNYFRSHNVANINYITVLVGLVVLFKIICLTWLQW